ncbi:MAG TPA: hypothetical protein VJ838_04750 [Gaiellaceae bacterium]|nr:hypothetical protein [Gaiellaceae bacterium]
MLVEIPYDKALEVIESFAPGTERGNWTSAVKRLQAVAEENRLEAIRPACALATVWRRDVKEPGFILPPEELVVLVEYLIGEPVWAKRYKRFYDLED